MTTLVEPRCSVRRCRHFLGILQKRKNDPLSLVPYCEAFPEGIPMEIGYGDNLHLKPYPGDHGIQYEPKEEMRGKRGNSGSEEKGKGGDER